MRNSFKRNIVVGFGFSLFLLLVSSAASFVSIKNLLNSAGWVDHTHQVIYEVEAVNRLLLEAETNQRGYLISQDESFLAPLQGNIAGIRERISVVKGLTADNPERQGLIRELSERVEARLELLNSAIRLRQQQQPVSVAAILDGKELMERARNIIEQLEDDEQRLLAQRTQRLKKFSDYTPILIVIAALISLATTGVFYGKIIADYRERVSLQEELIKKDEDISNRLNVLHDITEKISAGQYDIKVTDESRDILGSLAGKINKMSASLQSSFGTIANKEWLQGGLAGLAQQMAGEQNVEELSARILQYLVDYTDSKVGALYLISEDGRQLRLTCRHAVSEQIPHYIQLGDGLAGECAQQKKLVEINGLSENHFVLATAAGHVAPAAMVAVPLLHDDTVMGVIELGSLEKYTENEQQFLEIAGRQAGIAINGSKNRHRLQELLEETQAQAEELQVQHSELENINAQLRDQSQRLQVSEEELKVQQEELMQTNIELEERTVMLEEKNQLIEERNEEIHRKARELAVSTRYKSEFLANMSHELRTPLNSILLLSRLMLENNQENLTNDQIEYARVIQNSGQSLLALIDEILDLSKIEAGRMEMDFEQVSLHEITNDLSSLFLPLAREKNLDLNVNISKEAPDQIETDKMRLQQILKNLIANAIKFTAEGSVSLSVGKHLNHQDRVVFAVKDTGIGISPEKQQLIFEAFQQADGSTKRQYGGTGLGLSISRELARLLGGTIELSSEPGKGSEFRLIVPVQRPDEVPYHNLANEMLDEPVEPMIAQPQSREKKADADRGVLVTEDDTAQKMSAVFQRIEHVLKDEPKKVLIIEENQVHARALAYFLENFNIQPEIKHSIKDATGVLLEKDGACVIVDVGLNCDEMYAELENVKKHPRLEALPIIVFTGRSLTPMQEGRLKQSVNFIVLKTAHSYQRILDEVSLFLHIAGETNKPDMPAVKRMGRLTEVLKNKKVLVADDDVRNIFSLSKALEVYGMEVVTAMDGREALEQVQKDRRIDVVLMDMMMPEMDGYETMRKIRAMPGFTKLPIIAVTAKAMAGDREKCIAAGASDYITKPIDKDQLLSLLRVWLYDRIG